MKAQGIAGKGLVIGYDTRFLSREFAEAVATVMAGNGIKAYLSEKAAPTPVVSFNGLDPEPRNFKQGGYLDRLPVDPWGSTYLYLSPGENGEFDLYSLGADGLSGGDSQNTDLGNWDADQDN